MIIMWRTGINEQCSLDVMRIKESWVHLRRLSIEELESLSIINSIS